MSAQLRDNERGNSRMQSPQPVETRRDAARAIGISRADHLSASDLIAPPMKTLTIVGSKPIHEHTGKHQRLPQIKPGAFVVQSAADRATNIVVHPMANPARDARHSRRYPQ